MIELDEPQWANRSSVVPAQWKMKIQEICEQMKKSVEKMWKFLIVKEILPNFWVIKWFIEENCVKNLVCER
jgi:hypothetical protein